MRDGICVDPPLCRGTSQSIYGLRIKRPACEGETVGKIGEVHEMGERELVLVVSVKCGKERDMTRGCSRTQRCAFMSFAALEPRVFA